MARNEARIRTTIWDDEDWCALSGEAQWLYFACLSQKDLSQCGVLTWTPGRFAKLAANRSKKAVETALRELVTRRFVVLDTDTDELWVRRFLRWDRVLEVPNIVVAMSHDFCAVRSRVISEGLVAQIHETFPDGVAKGFAEKFPKEWVKGLWGRLARRFVDALGDGLPKQSARPSDEGLSEPTGEGSTEYQEEWSTEGTPEQTGEGSTEPSGEGSLTPARMRSPNCRTAEYPSSGPPTPEASPSGAKPAAGAAGEEDRRTEKPTNPAPAEPTVEERVTAVCEALARQDLETAVEDGDRVKNRPAWLRAAVANRLEADGPALRSEAARRPEASLGDLCLAFGGWDPDDPDGSKRAAESAERGRREILEPAQRWEDWCAEADRRIGAMAADERDGLRDGLTATIVAKREARGGKRRTGPLNGELTVAMREAVMGCEPDTWTEWPGAVAHRRDTGER